MARILLVEDDPVIADLHNRILKRLGYQTIIQVDSEEEVFDNLHAVDVVLMDVTLNKRLAGIKYCIKIKKQYPRLRVIFVSAFPWITFESKLTGVPYDGYIDKIHFSEDIEYILQNPGGPGNVIC